MHNILQYKNYSAAINFSAADEVLHGKVLDIDGLVLFEGTSVAEIKIAFAEAVEDYLEFCAELGKVPGLAKV